MCIVYAKKWQSYPIQCIYVTYSKGIQCENMNEKLLLTVSSLIIPLKFRKYINKTSTHSKSFKFVKILRVKVILTVNPLNLRKY